MLNFDKYFEYIKNSFKDYERIKVYVYSQKENELLIRISPVIANKYVNGYMEIRINDTNIAFYGSFFGDKFMKNDGYVCVLEKRAEEEIYDFLDKKIEECKFHIANGYFFSYFADENKWIVNLSKVVDDHKFDIELCEKVYHSFGELYRPFYIVKTVVITNFYGEVVDTIKVDNIQNDILEEKKNIINFEKYYDYVKNAFKDYGRIKVYVYCQDDELLLMRIDPNITHKYVGGFLEIKFDQDTIGFFGDFFGDEYIDEFDNTWEKYSEEEIYAFLDKKIEEYKYYIENGYFFNYYTDEGKWRTYLAEVVEDKKFSKEFCEKIYGKDIIKDEIKTVVISNFYGEAVETIKVNE